MSNEKTRIAFFFGAGVEGRGNFDIETGFDYLKKSIFSPITAKDNQEECFTKYLGEYWNNLSFFDNAYKYTTHAVDSIEFLLKNFIVQKCDLEDNFKEKYKTQIALILSRTILKKIYGSTVEFEGNDSTDAIAKNIKNEFKSIVTGEISTYKDIKCDLLRDLFACDINGKIVIDMNIGVAGSLDSYFHTIINPKKYGSVKFSKIVNYYWACYFTILRSVLCYLGEHGVEETKIYFKPPLYKQLDYERVLNNLKEVTELIYDPSLKYSIVDTYYQHIIDCLSEYTAIIECLGVATTNYYKFCSAISPNTIYLNGQLKLFECPEFLEVVDVTKTDISPTKFCFPFIFGQSLVKPIVDGHQIDEFFEFKMLLEQIDVLIVFGFNINEDDNHINSFLHDFVKKKKLIIVTDQTPQNFNAEKKLKCDGTNIEYCQVVYGNNREVVNQIFSSLSSLNQFNGGYCNNEN